MKNHGLTVRPSTDIASISVHDIMANPFCFVSPIQYSRNQFYQLRKMSRIINSMTTSNFLLLKPNLRCNITVMDPYEYRHALNHQKSPTESKIVSLEKGGKELSKRVAHLNRVQEQPVHLSPVQFYYMNT